WTSAMRRKRSSICPPTKPPPPVTSTVAPCRLSIVTTPRGLGIRFESRQIGLVHLGNHVFKTGCRLPAKLGVGLVRIAEKHVHFRRTKKFRVDNQVIVKGQPRQIKGYATHIPDCGGASGGDYIIVGMILLQHQPHGLDIVPGMPPVALGVDI